MNEIFRFGINNEYLVQIIDAPKGLIAKTSIGGSYYISSPQHADIFGDRITQGQFVMLHDTFPPDIQIYSDAIIIAYSVPMTAFELKFTLNKMDACVLNELVMLRQEVAQLRYELIRDKQPRAGVEVVLASDGKIHFESSCEIAKKYVLDVYRRTLKLYVHDPAKGQSVDWRDLYDSVEELYMHADTIYSTQEKVWREMIVQLDDSFPWCSHMKYHQYVRAVPGPIEDICKTFGISRLRLGKISIQEIQTFKCYPGPYLDGEAIFADIIKYNYDLGGAQQWSRINGIIIIWNVKE